MKDNGMPGDQGDAPEPAAVAGEWIVPAVSYVDPARRFCALCGRPIARRYWRASGDGEERAFCEPGHAALHATYPRRSTTSD